MNRAKVIAELEHKLQNPSLTLHSRRRDELILKDMKYIEELEKRCTRIQEAYRRIAERGLKAGQKFCYRDARVVVDSCEICESCLGPEDLAWNEGEEE